MNPKRININNLLKKISESDSSGFLEPNKSYTFLNPYSYLISRKSIEEYISFDSIYFDGISGVLLWNIFNKKKIKRLSFDMTSIADYVFRDAEISKKKIFIIGSTEIQVLKSTDNLLNKYPLLKMQYRNGYFISKEERNSTIHEIVKLKPDIVIVGMGALLQEKFIVDLKLNGWHGTGYTCGGFIHQIVADLIYYPTFIDKLNLRWLFRLVKEKEFRNRFLKSYLKFPFVFIFDLINFKSFYRIERLRSNINTKILSE